MSEWDFMGLRGIEMEIIWTLLGVFTQELRDHATIQKYHKNSAVQREEDLKMLIWNPVNSQCFPITLAGEKSLKNNPLFHLGLFR